MSRVSSVHGAVIIAGLLAITSMCQTATGQDSTGESFARSRLTVRMSSGTFAEFQYSRFFFRFLSGDVAYQVNAAGPSIGLTALPLDFIFGQVRIGIPVSTEEHASPDGPAPFKPDFMVILRGGFLWHVKNSPIAFEFAAGKVLLVQRHYPAGGGGLLQMGAPLQPGVVVSRQEDVGLLSFGICFSI